jgi:hypothetical protein
LWRSANPESIGAQARKFGSTYQLETLQRRITSDVVCTSEQISSSAPTGTPPLSRR